MTNRTELPDTLEKTTHLLNTQCSEHYLIQKIGYYYGKKDGRQEMRDEIREAMIEFMDINGYYDEYIKYFDERFGDK